MNDAILNESIIEESEPITPEELIAHLVQDVISDNSPDQMADEFVDEFILTDRPETGQILSLLETPSESLVELLKGMVVQSHQASIDALDTRGVNFLEELKLAVKERMTQLASDAA